MDKLIALTLEWYQKKGKKILGEETVCVNMLDVVQVLNINLEIDPLISDMYEVKKESGKKLQKFYKHIICTEKYDYFIGRYSNYECIYGGVVKISSDH